MKVERFDFRTSHTDFNGAVHAFVYDPNNDWLLNENWANGNNTSYAYNAIGQRTSATDANGSYTYGYDNRDRLTSEIKHDGSELVYGYDAAGNRTTLTTVVAGITNTATYTFDALNRMASVTTTMATQQPTSSMRTAIKPVSIKPIIRPPQWHSTNSTASPPSHTSAPSVRHSHP